ncbi:FAD-dependent 5-carboxymethylaminomethyl-2-thiouridine(34) oxidoreductase MnmC [Ideonella azotifigens]|uniref:tRNA 5-methylaminomethyl-2-thiouridine biosynthesis bifunctional protein MnmC n=3 Tax=Ideonella azotifigens TaxID=513160 RepID=A0ABP3V5B4_9BURK|nr:FAD-dependent 5-carboxymethylaminomethyl-2-thiouridine(34) oxidoreductase MnmC [Ideonella azotifigens]MCD2341315.1 FAD-dependent 5-carboxymethylaminomethyl-2-thiouridine(34) oxidoreductase MnmC [Ideonella azotifigens]
MKTEPLQQAHIVFNDPAHPGQAYAPDFGDAYHARLGAWQQARHVFLAGNDLPARWQRRTRFVILETGFGLGNNFLATWAAWREDPARCDQLVFLSVEKHPARREDLAQAHAACPQPALAAELLAQWPPATPDMHTLSFEQGRVQLLLALGDVATWMSEWVALVDAFYLDGFSPANNPAMWEPALWRQCSRLGTADTTLATWTWARPVRDGLSAAGFVPERRPGFGTKRDMLSARRRPLPDAPARLLAPPPGRRGAALPPRSARPAQALVIGAGLAGASAAAALARQGLQVTVLERQPAPASETSGNAAGLFHGVLHPQDGAHAQLLRAAALRATQVLAPLVASGQLPGQADGLLRTGSDEQDLPAMLAMAEHQGLPAAYVQALSTAQASALAQLALPGPGWWYPGGGWVDPAALVRHWLATPGVTLRTGQAVARLSRQDARWHAQDMPGQSLAEADVVVLAGAADALPLLAPWTDHTSWTLNRRRGQVTQLDRQQAAALGLAAPAHPVASGAYLLDLGPNGLLCGATNQLSDDADRDASPRAVDHLANLAQLDRLLGREASDTEVAMREQMAPTLGGRVGWRLTADDRMPVTGPVPLPAELLVGHRRLEQPRQVPRVPGLYLLTALGSRGITLSPLLGEVLAAWITGAPVPLSSSLLDAIDPARFVARAARRGG